MKKAAVVAPALLGFALHGHAAGGHHAVDDAALLAPGQCQFEMWFDRERGSGGSLLHAGPACRIGPVEVGLNVDHARSATTERTIGVTPQLKWATQLRDGLSIGAVLSATWQRSPVTTSLGSSLVFPFTWQPVDPLIVHANIGYDFRHHEAGSSRGGAALEWVPLPAMSFVAERFRESRSNYSRVGARWTVSPAFSVDFSRTVGHMEPRVVWWTLGTTWLVGSLTR